MSQTKHTNTHTNKYELTTVNLGAVMDLSLFSMVNQFAQICKFSNHLEKNEKMHYLLNMSKID